MSADATAASDLDAITASVGVVVTNFNGGDKVLECLRHIFDQDLPPQEVVVVDNASADGSVPRICAGFPRARVVRLAENGGPSVARNVGLRSLTTELTLLIDSDIYLAKDGLAHLVRARETHLAAAICPRIRLLPEADIVQADGAALHFVGGLTLINGSQRLADEPCESRLVAAVPGGCLLVDRAEVLAAGGFDELFFFYHEDLEFSLRLRALGHSLAWTPAAVAYHDRGSGTPGLAFRGQGAYPPRRAYLLCRNRLLVMFVHFRLRTLVVLAPVLLVYEVACMSLAAVRGWLPGWGRAWLWQLRHVSDIRSRRRRMQTERVLDDRDLLSGGPIPLTPGLLRSPLAATAVGLLSAALDAYWRHARRWIG